MKFSLTELAAIHHLSTRWHLITSAANLSIDPCVAEEYFQIHHTHIVVLILQTIIYPHPF